MNEGIIYLIQPSYLIGTNRYKIGCSGKATTNRINSYNEGTKTIMVMNCDNPFVVEKKLIQKFNEKFKLISGKEYFEGDIELMKKEFIKLINEISMDKNEIDENDITKNEIIENEMDENEIGENETDENEIDENETYIKKTNKYSIAMKNKQHICEICKCGFTNKSNLYNHRKKICIPKHEKKQEYIKLKAENQYQKKIIEDLLPMKELYNELNKKYTKKCMEYEHLLSIKESYDELKNKYMNVLEKSAKKLDSETDYETSSYEYIKKSKKKKNK